MASVAEIAPLSTEFDVPSKKGTRGPDKGPRAPAGFKKAIEEIAQVIFSKSKISVEGATAAVVPSIPKLIADISNDIRTGSVEKFKISLEKLEKLIDSLGLDLKKYNKNLSDFLKKRADNIVRSEEKILDLRERGAKVEIDQVSGNINVLSKEEIKQRTDTLKQTLISLERTKKAKDKEEKILQKRSSLSEEEIETKKKNVQQSYENIKTLEEQKENLMKVLNIQNEEDLPSTGFFSRMRRGAQNTAGGVGQGFREYTPNFIQETIGAFGDQIRGFIEPFVIMKDVVFDLLKPLKLLGKLFMPLLKGFGRLIKMIGLQIASGLALVAVNLLRILTDKKVLIGLGAMAALFGLKELISKAKDGPDGPTPGSAGDMDAETYLPDDASGVSEEDKKLYDNPYSIFRKPRIHSRSGETTKMMTQDEMYKVDLPKRENINKTMMTDSTSTSKSMNVNNANSVSNSQTSNQSNVTNIASNDVHNNKNVWVNQIV